MNTYKEAINLEKESYLCTLGYSKSHDTSYLPSFV